MAEEPSDFKSSTSDCTEEKFNQFGPFLMKTNCVAMSVGIPRLPLFHLRHSGAG